MSNFRKLKNGDEAEELNSSVQLIIKTKCPTKWILIDEETGQVYRGSNSNEVGKMWELIRP